MLFEKNKFCSISAVLLAVVRSETGAVIKPKSKKTKFKTKRAIHHSIVASSRIDFKTHQYSISYLIRNRSKRFRIFFTQFVNQLTKLTTPNRFQTEKSGRK